MAFLRKIKAGLVKTEIEEFIGEEGNIFFNVTTGELRLSNGTTPGGISLGSGGGTVNDTFSTIKVSGSPDLVALGLDTIEFVAGQGIAIESSISTTKKITLTSSGFGNLDGGNAFSSYGGLDVIDGGGI